MTYYTSSDFDKQFEELKECENKNLSYLEEKLNKLQDRESFVNSEIREKEYYHGKYGLQRITYRRQNDLRSSSLTRRACISSITHRIYKNEKKKPYDITVYQGLTEVKRRFDSLAHQNNEPPVRENHDIHGFSKASRLRLIKKCNKIKHKDLPMPYFMHLTYHENVNNCKLSKKDLDNFLKRLRRLAKKRNGYKLRYIWKMEFQKRGAIHYHLAVVMGESFDQEGLNWFRKWTGNAWADVTDGSGDQREVGTRIDNIDSWKAFSGYVSKYCSKPENNINTATGKPMPTGRFWGMSQNWDMSPYFECTVDKQERDEMREVFTDISTQVYKDRVRYIKTKKISWFDRERMLVRAFNAYKNQVQAINLSYTYSLYSDAEIMHDICRHSFRSSPPDWKA